MVLEDIIELHILMNFIMIIEDSEIEWIILLTQISWGNAQKCAINKYVTEEIYSSKSLLVLKLYNPKFEDFIGSNEIIVIQTFWINVKWILK